ncbi:DUF4190 domain-containing protein [Streptomyces bullii]|uniref:DUF4190 domain-containing protein n=1 Tax=Streptomyces bullii TaxID=349910 RepID=A0ABW0UYA5_9ACTN
MSDDARKPDAPGAPDVPAGTAGDPWAPPTHDTAAHRPKTGGPGHTLASNTPLTWPVPSVHDQQTVTSMPAMDEAMGGAGSAPASPPAPSDAPSPSRPWAGPFSPPAPTAPGSGPANPFAAPAPPAPHPQDAPVPPPPIAPDGPGQVPYGYPGGYGHPAVGGPGQGGTPSQGYYGWPGVTPLPSNGLGTAGLVLGIIAAAGFCLWPLAIVLGVLALIFGIIGRQKATRGEATNPGQSLAGIICGAVGLALGIGMGVLVIATR